MEQIKNNFPDMVKQSGLKQKFIADKVGMSYSAFSNVMKGGLPELPNAIKLARFFGKSVEEIWVFKEE